MSEKWHSGITMHKLSFGGGFIGLLFAAGSSLIFVLGFPTLWYFVALAFALGLCIAIFLRIASRRLFDRHKPLSILTAENGAESASGDNKKRVLFQIFPKLASAQLP